MISVSVPATSANLGVGYDVLGLALISKLGSPSKRAPKSLRLLGMILTLPMNRT